MKVAIIMPVAEQRGGAEMMLLHLLRANRRGPKVEYHLTFLEDGPMVREVIALGYSAQVFQAGQLRQVSRQIETVRNLRRWMKDENIQIAMSWMEKAHLYAGPAAKMAGIPNVWCQHIIPDGHWMSRWAALIPTRKIFCSSQSAQHGQQKLKPKRETCVIFPAVDLTCLDPVSLPSPKEARRALGLPERGLLIGTVCRLQRSKGVHVFLDAAAEIAKTHADVHFIIVGGKHALEPNCPDVLAAQAASLGLKDKVMFTGYQSNTIHWMQAMDVVVLASVGTESFGMVIIEAMALGKPVIASRAGGPQEIIEDGVDGYLTEQGNVVHLASTIEIILNGKHSIEAVSSAARRKAASFSTDRLAEEVAKNLRVIAL